MTSSFSFQKEEMAALKTSQANRSLIFVKQRVLAILKKKKVCHRLAIGAII